MSRVISKRRRPGRPSNPVSQEDILAVALEEFGRAGYAGAGLKEIARRLKIRRQSLLYHFPGKKDLYLATLALVVGNLTGLVVATGLESNESFVKRLDRLGEQMVSYLGGHRYATRLLLSEMSTGGLYLREAGGDAIQRALAATARFLKSGMDAGVFRKCDPQQLTMSIVGLHFFYFGTSLATSRFLGVDIFKAKAIERRRRELLKHVRALTLRPARSPRA